MIVLSPPDTDGSRVPELCDDEPPALVGAVAAGVRVLIVHDQAIATARGSTDLAEGRRHNRVAQRSSLSLIHI